ncbi:MAG TPA: GNAT family N-acetyltransferase [Tepidisphaeraceae bacterium]|jgi:predicted N-acyltransferase|nr:GNAT family N-acetyltransferase [Tepidisphaeraceae bacterium]
MVDQSSLPRLITAHSTVYVAERRHIDLVPSWQQAFANSRKDRRYYEIVEDTIQQGFDYRYFVLEDRHGKVQAIQPFFLLDQDLLQGSPASAQKWAGRLRKVFPRALTIRTLMVGCAAGEGHLDHTSDEHAEWIANSLHDALVKHARMARASMIVLKEFPAHYRGPLSCFSNNGYTRVPSLPFTRLNIDYENFEAYMNATLSKSTRKDLRRKFRDAADAAPIELEVVTDVTPYVDEVYPLYLNVYRKSPLQFERLTKNYLCRLGQEMPDKTRFFIWRQNGRAIAFSLCMLHGDSLYDEYLGLDYDVALDLHLYFYTLRDVVEWSIKHGLKWYCSSSLNYDPKRRLKCELMPMDLYVTHTSPAANFVLRRVLPLLEPTRNDKTLREFPNYDTLWGKA